MKAAALITALVAAYVLPAYGILKRLAKGRDELALTTMKVDGAANVGPALAREVAAALNVDWSSGELAVTFTASMKFPGRCRFELSSPNTTKKVVAVSSNGKRKSEGLELPALQAIADEVCALIVLRGATDDESRQSVERHLAALKVNSRNVFLGRFGGSLTWVLGDVGDAPQLWVYKPIPGVNERVVPARVRWGDDKGNKWDLQLYDWGSAVGSEWFPRVLELKKGGEPQLKLTALNADVKLKLGDELF